MWNTILIAIALFLIIEGVLPFVSPGHMRQLLEKMLHMTDQQLRFVGFTSMLTGVILLFFVR